MPTTPNFAAAARRHHDDAALLSRENRLPNADHLAGISAECGLKAILLGYLGATLDHKDRPTHSSLSKNKHFGHIDGLWMQLHATVRGRGGAQFAALITGQNPFSSWDIAERYSSGEHVDRTRADQHLAQAQKILQIHQRAVISGVLP